MTAPRAVEQKVVDPESELSNAQMTFKRLAPLCSVAKRALGVPQLAAQEKQHRILNGELVDTKLCISMATKGLHAIRDGRVKRRMRSTLEETDELASELRDQRAQLLEINCLNYLTQKQILELVKQVRSEADELAKIENALNRLKQIENRLDIATKRFCVVNYDNSQIRLEIHRLLVERDSFNIMWNRTIGKLVKGKMYLLDIFEIAANAFGDRDECCRKLEALKWKGLYGLNRDISEMQQFESELNHLTKLEQFLRVKGSRRICEADEKEERRRQEDKERCEMEIAKLDDLLNEIFVYTHLDMIPAIVARFKCDEIRNFSMFELLCIVVEELIMTRSLVDNLHQIVLTQREMNQARAEREAAHLAVLRHELELAQARTRSMQEADAHADVKIASALKGIEDLTKLGKTDIMPLLSLLGPHEVLTRWNVGKHLQLLECEVKTLLQVAYGLVSPPTPAAGKGGRKSATAKIVSDPVIETLKPNTIDKLVDYQPCAYCVEDYMMNLVFEMPAVVATEEYVESILHLEDINTKFGIYSLTIPTKRHPYRG